MALPSVNPGKESYLEIEMVHGGGDYDFLCTVDNITYRADKEEENIMLWDCADPTADLTRSSKMISAGESYNINGKVSTADASYARLRSLRLVDTEANFRWYIGTALNSGKRHAFLGKVSNWEESKEGGNTLKFSCTITVQGETTETSIT